MASSVSSENLTPTSNRHVEASRVAREIEALCVELGVGARLPRHTELMKRIGASQYNVIRVLEDLQRAGRVVRRHGSGTYITEPSSAEAVVRNDVRDLSVQQAAIAAISRPDGGFFDRCVELLYDETERRGLALTCHFMNAGTMERVDPASLGNPKGFIVFRHDLAPLGRALLASGSRVVLVGAPHLGETFGIPCVCGNHERGAYLLTKHLIESGHRHIAYGDISGNLLSHSRWMGHSKLLAEAKRAGLNIAHRLVARHEMDAWTADPHLAKAYFAESGAPTALVMWNDLEALDALSLLGRAGVAVPGDVTVVGFDNDDAGRRVFPALTTIDHAIGEQITAAIDMLLDDKASSPNERLIFAPTLIRRESSAAPTPR